MTMRWMTVVGMVLLAGAAAAQEPEVLEGHKEQLSYALGMNFWIKLRDQSVEVDPELCIQGFRDALSESKTLLTEAEVRTILTDLQTELRQRQRAAQTEKPSQRNRSSDEADLAVRKARESASAQLKDIKASFKLDPLLTQGLYMGDRWVSPPTYTGVRQEGTEYSVDARAYGIDARGQRIPLSPEWIPSNPEMVVVSPAEANTVKITVKQAGESMLNVAANGLSRAYLIKATSGGDAMQVEISSE